MAQLKVGIFAKAIIMGHLIGSIRLPPILAIVGNADSIIMNISIVRLNSRLRGFELREKQGRRHHERADERGNAGMVGQPVYV